MEQNASDSSYWKRAKGLLTSSRSLVPHDRLKAHDWPVLRSLSLLQQNLELVSAWFEVMRVRKLKSHVNWSIQWNFVGAQNTPDAL